MINNFLNFIIGITLFLFAINNLTKDLKNINHHKIEKLLNQHNNKYRGILIGTFTTMIIQSSSFVTVLLVSLVDSGLMSLNDSIGIIMGSNIGTCLTSWILSLSHLNSYNSLFSIHTFLGIMAILTLFFFRKKQKNKANLTFSLIILILGMNIMSESLLPLTKLSWFTHLLYYLTNPLLGLIAGIIITAIFQSSSVVIGIIESLTISKKINFLLGFTLILGSNIGTCITSLIASINTNKTSKKVSMFHLLFNIIGTLIFLIGFYILNYFFQFTFTFKPINAFHIALIHTLFNILSTFILLPFTKKILSLCDYFVK